MKYTIKTAHWRVPSEARAFDGWLEGRPTADQRTAILTAVARERENWAPNSEAWGQLQELERFVGKRVCIQFWDPNVLLLDDEGPYPMLADCQAIALIRREGFLQAYLMLDRIEECPDVSGYSPAKFLERQDKLGCSLAPIAEVAEIEDVGLRKNHLSEPAAPLKEQEERTMRSPKRTAATAAYVALRNGLLRSAPNSVVDVKGYVCVARQNLIDGIELSDIEADFRQGNGNELEKKFRAAHSSSALAANTFAPFKSKFDDLQLFGAGGFKSLHFERKCPNGVEKLAPANLDVLVKSPERVVAIESKCTEHLKRHKAKFSQKYDERITDGRRETSWFRVMKYLIDKPTAYCWLDAGQLVKHALALLHTYPKRRVTMLYLFWEPANPLSFPTFEQHRTEIGRFAESVDGDGPAFKSMSYQELWKSWDLQVGPDWLSTHLRRLRVRYDVEA